jgi:hypothetical protein
MFVKKNMIKIKGFGIIEQILPIETKFLTREKYFKFPYVDGKQIRQRLFKTPIIKELKDITKNDYIGTEINQKSIPIMWDGVEVANPHYLTTKVKNDLNLNDENFWWFVGRVIADGWVISYKRKNRRNGYIHKVVLCCGKHEFEYVKKRLSDLQYTATISEERTVYKFTIHNTELWEFLNKFGRYSYGKFIPYDVINMPIDILEKMLEGYFSGDGYIDKRGNQTMATVSEKLAETLKKCISKVYKVPVKHYLNDRSKFSHSIEGRLVNQRASHILSFKKEVKKQDKGFYEDGYTWAPLSKIELI